MDLQGKGCSKLGGEKQRAAGLSPSKIAVQIPGKRDLGEVPALKLVLEKAEGLHGPRKMGYSRNPRDGRTAGEGGLGEESPRHKAGRKRGSYQGNTGEDPRPHSRGMGRGAPGLLSGDRGGGRGTGAKKRGKGESQPWGHRLVGGEMVPFQGDGK